MIDDTDNASDYWKWAKQVLKEENDKERTEHYDKRIEYAISQFKNNGIEYKLCNESNGHFNLLKNKKVVMSFWSWTGKCYIPSTGFSENIGIKNCIKEYIKLFGGDK